MTDLTRVQQIYQEIIDLGYLEDRTEYQLEDLSKMYGLPEEETKYLYRLIQSDASGLYKSQWKPEDALKVAQNITESIHQYFDGWTDAEKVIIQLYLSDLNQAVKETK